MSGKRDYYEVLGVPTNVGDRDIKKAYRKLALQFHPDRNPDNKDHAEEKFKEITEAYGVLADPQKRAAYDRYGHAGLGGAGSYAPDFSSSIFADFEDILGDLFGFGDLFGGGGGRRRTRAHRGEDRRYDLEIAFEEAATGVETNFKYLCYEGCQQCRGQGTLGGAATCETCYGRGQIRHQQGFFTVARTCPQCQGAGQVIRNPCKKCNGEGRVRREKTLALQIPGGVEDGNRLRIRGEGDAGLNGGPRGDLYVVIHVKAHSVFDREKEDLFCSISLSLAQAALGTQVKVPTLGKEEKLKIPAGTQSGSTFRLRGRGFPRLDGRGKGDLYVTINVAVPTQLTREQRRLMEQLDEVLAHKIKAMPRKAFEHAVRDA